MVPVGGGVLSALGMLAAPRSRQITRSIGQRLDELSDQQITLRAAALSAQGSHDLQGEGVSKDELSSELFLDLRYLGQSHALTVPWSSIAQVTEQFHRQHEQRYGHRLELAVELVSLRASVSGPQPQLSLSGVLSEIAKTSGAQRQVKEDARVRLLQRSELMVNQRISGPALIVEPLATTWVADGWTAVTDGVGNLLLTRELATQ